MPASTAPDIGTRVIVAYKLVRGGLSLALALALAGTLVLGGASELHRLAETLHDNVSGAWSLRISALLVRASKPRSLEWGAAALTLDGVFTLFEGWALGRRFRWASWLVVIATSSLLPFEFAALAHGFHPGRLILALTNVAVVVYLVQRKVAQRVD